MAVPMWVMADIDHGDVTSPNPDDYDPYAWARTVPRFSPIIHIKQSMMERAGIVRSRPSSMPRAGSSLNR